jgi:PAS domain S-box-containing protein
MAGLPPGAALEPHFDDIARLAAILCDSPVGLVTRLDAQRETVIGRYGLESQAITATPRDASFGAQVAIRRELLNVHDVASDPRFSRNPLVDGPPFVRFYAGAPILGNGGVVGTVCVMDQQPRELPPDKQDALRLLAARAAMELDTQRHRDDFTRETAALSRSIVSEPTSGAPPGLRRRVAAVVFLLGVALTVLAAYRSRAASDQRTRERFAHRTEQAAQAVSGRVRAYQSLLRSAQAFFAASAHVDREEWRRFAEIVIADGNWPAVRALGCVAYVPEHRLAAFERRAHSFGPDFAIWPRRSGGDHLVQVYLHPPNAGGLKLGYDLGSDPEYRRAALLAADTGRATLSRQSARAQTSRLGEMLLFMPVYDTGVLPLPSADRRTTLDGWVAAALDTRELFHDLPSEQFPDLRFELFDGPPQAENLVLGEGTPPPRADEAWPPLSSREALEIGGRFWTLHLFARPGFAESSAEALVILVGGLLATIAAAAALVSMASRQRRILNVAGESARALHESESRIRTVVDHIADAVITYDTQGRIKSFNLAAERLFGYAPSDILGQDISALLPQWQKAGPEGAEIEGLSREGKSFPVEVSVSTANAGALLIAIAHDITARRREEEAQKESERRLARFLEAMPVGVFVVDGAGTAVFANAAAREILGAGIVPGLHVDDSPTVYQAYVAGQSEIYPLERLPLARALGGEVAVAHDMEIRQPDKVVPLEVAARPIHDSAGNVIAAIAAFQDVTDRKHMEEALRSSEVRLSKVVEHMLEGLLVIGEDGVIESVNPAFMRMTGFGSDELVGQHLSRFVKQPLEPDTGEPLEDFYRQGLGRVTEWAAQRKNGEVFPCELSLFEFRTAEGRHYAGAVRDLSERREVERMKREFVATVSHELRTPMTSIRGSLGLLSAGVLGELSDEALDVVRLAERNSLRLITLINDILDLERLKAGRLELVLRPLALSSVIERSLESVRAVAEQRGIALDAQPTKGRVLGDADRLVQVLVNLLSNAVKFSPQGSAVRVSALEAPPGFVEVRVADRGRGIPVSHRERIFERFQQVEASDARQKGGTGLGLAISKSIVEQHGGMIGVESEEERGSTFWFRVPAAVPEGERADDALLASLTTSLGEAGDQDVLLVDDDEALLGVMARQLLSHAISVRTATTVREAKRLAVERPPRLLVLDLGLPDGDGSLVIEELNRDPRLRATPLLVYTARDLTDAQRAAYRLGSTRYLTKSRGTEAEFMALVQELLGQPGSQRRP